MADKKNWLQLLAYVTGSINQELLLRNEYLTAENNILKSRIKGRLRLSDGERATLVGIARQVFRCRQSLQMPPTAKHSEALLRIETYHLRFQGGQP